MWFTYLLIVLFLSNLLSTTLLIGEERKPITKGTAVTSIIINGLLALGVFHFYL